VLADAPQPLGGAWHGREIVFAASSASGLLRVEDRGGNPRVLTTPDRGRGEVRHAWPSVTPDGRTLLFTIDTTRDGEAPGDVAALSLDSSRPSWRTIVSGGGLARAAASDLVVFTRGSDLQAVFFDPLRQALTGEPRTLVTNVAAADGLAHFALSASGDLLVAQADATGGGHLSWLTSDATRPVAPDTRRLRAASLSPDGLRIAAIGTGEGRADVWVTDVERGAATRLTHERINASPIWSADGRTIYFSSRTDGPFEIWRREADGASPVRRVLTRESHAFPGSASPDGSLLAVVSATAQNGTDVLLHPLRGGGVQPLLDSPFDEDAPAFSPSGTMIAYQSSDTGRWQVYVQRLSDKRRVLVSTSGGDHPAWSRDGSFLIYRTEGGLERAAVVETTEGPQVGDISRLGTRGAVWIAGVAPDGRILIDPRGSSSPTRAVMSVGWAREARQLLGPPAAQMPR
jgi:Tol biopolymer transport system component